VEGTGGQAAQSGGWEVTAPLPERKQRSEPRASFAPDRRPLLHLADGSYPVLDISLHGLRIRHFNPVRPDLGARIAGTLQFPDQRPPLPFEGIIIRVQTADVAIRCEESALPQSWILEEVARSEANSRS
jgi:hypothetical protein